MSNTKISDLKVWITHESHKKNKRVWKVREIWRMANKSVSQKHIRNALNDLEQMNLIEHEKNEQKYYFNLNA